MATELKTVTWHDDGNLDVSKLIDNTATVRDAVDEVERLRAGMAEDVGAMYPASISYAVDAFGEHVVLGKTVRADMKITQAFVMAGADGEETTIDILKNCVDALCEPIVLKATESRGKVVIGDVLDYVTISRFDEIVVKTDTNRRVVVTLNFGEVE